MAAVDVYAEFPGQLRPLLRAEYDQLVKLGCFGDEKIELLEGALVEMSPEGPEHSWVIQRLTKLLIRGLSDEWAVRVGHPWAASDRSEPEPDLAIVEDLDYRSDHPEKGRLLIEVARSSRRKDLKVKAGVYAAAGLQEYWVFDLVERAVFRHTDPTRDGYRTITRHGAGDRLDVEGLGVELSLLFGES
ncbi:MAG: Uma2 family endonuclease [Acidimicrobiales bacterium]